MRVLLTGATGFIGSAVLARLADDGDEVVAVARDIRRAAARRAGARWIELDVARAPPEAWRSALCGVDAVVNCAGLLAEGADAEGVHARGPAALFAACEAAGVRRVIHISAIGVDRETPSDFSASKRRGEEALANRDLDWVILRPSVVLGPAAYGGGALFRGLAALPVTPVVPQAGELQVVQLDDVVETIRRCLGPGGPVRRAIDLAGPERLAFHDVVARYRRWFGWKPARVWTMPGWMATTTYLLGDAAAWLGWRPAVRTVAGQEIRRGAIGDPAAWSEATGVAPKSLDAALTARPASTQERWFAQLYFLKPVIFGVLTAFWIGTGVISLTIGYGIGRDMMLEGGAGRLSGPSVIAGALADIAIGLGIATRRYAKTALKAAIGLSLFYAAAGSAILPRLWADPLGPMLKIWPILVLIVVALAILEDR